MNTWRDIKKDPPKDMQSAIVTDGESVWAGFIRRYGKDYTDLDKIYATNLNDGSHDVLYLEDLTEWQPIQVDRVEKSADEQFRELGYEPVESGYLREYRKTEPNGNKIKICVAHGNNMQMTCEGKAFWMMAEEVLACAQLIKEMEAEG